MSACRRSHGFPGFVARLCAAGPLLALALVAAGAPLMAQEEPRNKLPDGVLIDPETDPAPFDAMAEVRKHLLTRIATSWWISEPERTANTFFVRVHVPFEWRGNPVSAMLMLCPDANDPLWDYTATIDLQPFYQNRPWPTVTCRR